MTQTSPLNFVHKVGKFGDHEEKNESDLLKISEVNGLLIFQIAQYKNSNFDISKIKLDGLSLPSSLNSTSNFNTRILWFGPNCWLVFSSDLDLIEKEKNHFNETDFAVTDISHSRTIIELEGSEAIEVLKKGCPFNFNTLEKNNSINSTYNGITFTIDMISDNPCKIRLFALRSFGESLYHSIADASLEFGFKSS